VRGSVIRIGYQSTSIVLEVHKITKTAPIISESQHETINSILFFLGFGHYELSSHILIASGIGVLCLRSNMQWLQVKLMPNCTEGD
jgi:hypothetical protein